MFRQGLFERRLGVVAAVFKGKRKYLVAFDDPFPGWYLNVEVDPLRRRESEAVLGQLREQLRDAIPRLPDISREVLVLHYYRGLTHVEIGQALGIPTGTVKSRMHQAVEALRRFFPVAEPKAQEVAP